MKWRIKFIKGEISGSRGGKYEGDCLLGCCTSRHLLTFQMCLLPPSSLITLMMEAASTSETSVNFYLTTWRNNPEDSHL
jgi:hypothetical protein